MITIPEAMQQYEAHLRAKGRKDRTIYNNLQPVKHLWRVAGEIQIASIRPQHIDKLFAAGNWSPRTRNLYLGNLSLFFKYCRRMRWMPKDFDPTEGWDSVKVPRKEALRIMPEEFGDLLDAARHPRDRALIALGLFTFCRSSELVTLRVDDIDFNQHTVTIFRWKTGEADVLPMVTELEVELLRWVNWYGEAVGGLQGSYYLVPALYPRDMDYDAESGLLRPSRAIQKPRPNKPMSHPYEPVQYALNVLGYDTKQTGGHTLRRSGALALFQHIRNQGYDGALRHVASMLGHKDTKMTETYLGLGMERLQRNEMLAGKPMLPDLVQTSKVTRLEAV
jgi:integrase